MRKKMISIVTAIAMIGCITACGKEAEVSEPASDNTQAESTSSQENEDASFAETTEEPQEMGNPVSEVVEAVTEMTPQEEVMAACWITQVDWPVDPRWDEHTDVECVQMADMFFYIGQDFDEVVNEFKNSETEEIWDYYRVHVELDPELRFDGVVWDDKYPFLNVYDMRLHPLNTGLDCYIETFIWLGFDENKTVNEISYESEGRGEVWGEEMASFIRRSKDDVLIKFDFHNDGVYENQ